MAISPKFLRSALILFCAATEIAGHARADTLDHHELLCRFGQTSYYKVALRSLDVAKKDYEKEQYRSSYFAASHGIRSLSNQYYSSSPYLGTDDTGPDLMDAKLYFSKKRTRDAASLAIKVLGERMEIYTKEKGMLCGNVHK